MKTVEAGACLPKVQQIKETMMPATSPLPLNRSHLSDSRTPVGMQTPV